VKLQSLRVEQLRQFRQPFVLDNLQPGLNLIHGPNESGKSTLVRAIRAAFFENYRSNTIDDLRPWGDSSAAPTIHLEFEHQGTPWRLAKSFLKQKRCDLTVGTTSYSEQDAQEKLAELLGYQIPNKGASKASHWGIPGLLWVEQGTGQDIERAVEHAGDHLQSALNALVGDVASTGGDVVIEQVSAERSKLLTRTGQPTADYRQLVETLATLKEQREVLRERVARYQEHVDRLQTVTRDFQRDEQERPWESAEAQLKQAQTRLTKLEQLERQQEQEAETLRHVEQQYELTDQSLSQLKRTNEQRATRKLELDRAEQQLQTTHSQTQSLAQQLADARAAYEKAQAGLKAARQVAVRQQLTQEIERLSLSRQALEKNGDKARTYQSQAVQARQQAAENNIDGQAVQRLKATELELNNERIRSRTIATRLNWELEPEATLVLNGHPLKGQGEQQLLEASRLTIPGVGTLGITPGGEELAATRRKLESLEQTHQQQLAALGVVSIDDAEQRKAAFDGAAQQRQHAEELLRSVAPGGIEALEAELADLQAELKSKHEQLQANPLPDGAESAPGLAQAEADFTRVESALRECERQMHEHETLRLTRQQARDNADAEWQRLNDEIQGDEHQFKLAELHKRLMALVEEKQQKQARLEQRAEEIQQARPDILRQDIKRYQSTIENLRNLQQTRDREIREIKARLEAWGAEGLEEKLSEAEAEFTRCERRYQELDRRAGALDLLLSLLTEKRQELTRRLQAPLQKHLNHYVSLLFPQATLEVDEQLQPGTFTRGNEFGQIGELSFGAREQMGLISRLAYADLLQEADRPTLILLDDTLVHSDQNRLDDMKRILFDAATRHQILLFTCHPEKWQDLGVPPVDLEQLKKAAVFKEQPGR